MSDNVSDAIASMAASIRRLNAAPYEPSKTFVSRQWWFKLSAYYIRKMGVEAAERFMQHNYIRTEPISSADLAVQAFLGPIDKRVTL